MVHHGHRWGSQGAAAAGAAGRGVPGWCPPDWRGDRRSKGRSAPWPRLHLLGRWPARTRWRPARATRPSWSGSTRSARCPRPAGCCAGETTPPETRPVHTRDPHHMGLLQTFLCANPVAHETCPPRVPVRCFLYAKGPTNAVGPSEACLVKVAMMAVIPQATSEAEAHLSIFWIDIMEILNKFVPFREQDITTPLDFVHAGYWLPKTAIPVAAMGEWQGSSSLPGRRARGRLAWQPRGVRRVDMPPEGELELMNRSPISMVPSPTLILRRGRLPPRLLGVGPADPHGRTATDSYHSALVIANFARHRVQCLHLNTCIRHWMYCCHAYWISCTGFAVGTILRNVLKGQNGQQKITGLIRCMPLDIMHT